MKLALCGVLCAAGVWATVSAAEVHAGTATIHQCAGPAGQIAATDMVRAPDVSRMEVSMACGVPGADWQIRLRRGGPGFDPANPSEVLITGPAGTVISGGRIERQLFGYVYSTAVGQATWGFGYRLSDAERRLIERCGTEWPYEGQLETCGPAAGGWWQFPTTAVDLPTAPTPVVRIGFGCYRNGSNCQGPLRDEFLGIRRMTLRVADVAAPVVTGAVGPLAADEPVRTRMLSINASDVGLGLYRLIVSVDGRVTETQWFEPAATACRDADPNTADPYEFNAATACPTVSSSRTFHLSSLPASGMHQVRVDVEDASGNRTAAVDRVATFALPSDGLRCPTAGCVRPPPRPNGVNASPSATLAISGKRTLRLNYGRKATVSGRLVNSAGLPIAAAQLEVSQRVTGSSAWTPAGQVQTDAGGRFRYVGTKGASRVLAVQYRPTLDASDVGTTAQVTVRVRAGVTMTLRPKTVNPGGTVRVRGRLLGEGVQAGTLVELQAMDGREWRTFKTLPVKRGRFAYRYRFRHTSGGARFLWRIHVRAQAGLPYSAGTSRAAWVSVRP
ncbi:hypothetical protein C8N24_0631 [Solirubrobacter pauli]|uniref:Carboxypeptidase family protein n=1 Tax=Solirubrobacter pauli TaxID=166793 RepID=A0A660L8V6_9ACTN|nr:carboxypeptidase-like regulatory domain-containing protein [Solirubrobacter pauli]RKQ90816.1 hypothetical protein C8N24_0631 [Solirubrobacter pauli]